MCPTVYRREVALAKDIERPSLAPERRGNEFQRNALAEHGVAIAPYVQQ